MGVADREHFVRDESKELTDAADLELINPSNYRATGHRTPGNGILGEVLGRHFGIAIRASVSD
jgi:hypothetical protein